MAVPSGLVSCSFLLVAGWYRESASVKMARASGRITLHQWEMPITLLGGSNQLQACRSPFQKTHYPYNLFRASCWIQFSVILFFLLFFPTISYIRKAGFHIHNQFKSMLLTEPSGVIYHHFSALLKECY